MKASQPAGSCRHRRVSRTERERLLADLWRSGLFGAAFARQRQICYATSCNWRHPLGQAHHRTGRSQGSVGWRPRTATATTRPALLPPPKPSGPAFLGLASLRLRSSRLVRAALIVRPATLLSYLRHGLASREWSVQGSPEFWSTVKSAVELGCTSPSGLSRALDRATRGRLHSEVTQCFGSPILDAKRAETT